MSYDVEKSPFYSTTAGQEESTLKLIAEKPLEDYSEEKQIEILRKEKEKLKKTLEERNEKIRKLKLVKMYREKNDLNALDELISKWREAAQEAIQELYNINSTEPKPSLAVFLESLHIDTKLLRFDAEDDCFW